MLEKTLESSLDWNGIQPVHPKGNQSWIFIGRTDDKAETPVLWPPILKNWLIGKDPDAGKDWRQEEKETIEGEMVGWHGQLNGHEFEQAPGVGDGQQGLACSKPWGHKESHTTERLNWTEVARGQWRMRKFGSDSLNAAKGGFATPLWCSPSTPMVTDEVKVWLLWPSTVVMIV